MKRSWLTAVGILCITWIQSLQALAAELPDFTGIVEKNSPAVVKILSTQRPQAGGAGGAPEVDPRYYEQLPDIFKYLFEQRGQQPPRERQSMGSGFIISNDGYILTNNHVVEGSDSVVVRLPDRREFEAKIVGADKRSDLALLRVDGGSLPVVTLGRTDELKVGEWVIAIGSPFGLDYSVSQGIVSAKGRSLPSETGDNYVPFIQTDVAINPGNSGGPLINMKGEVVGINSQIYTRSGGSIGLSFAIPIGVALDVVEQLKTTGEVVRGWLGVGIQEVDRNLAQSFHLDKPTGALVSQIEPGGPADKAGIKIGDIVTELNDVLINDSADLPHVVGLVKPGTEVKLKVVREGKPMLLDVTVGKLGSGDEPSVAQASSTGGRLGLEVEDLGEQQKTRANLSGGVVVRSVVPNRPGARAGLRAGDVITQVGNDLISDAAGFEALAEELPANTHIPIRLIRRGQAGFVAIRIEE